MPRPIVLVALLLAACGQTGVLVHPDQAPASTAPTTPASATTTPGDSPQNNAAKPAPVTTP